MEVASRKFIDMRKYNRKIAWLSSANCEGLKEKEIAILLGFNVRISCPNFDREFRPPHHLIAEIFLLVTQIAGSSRMPYLCRLLDC